MSKESIKRIEDAEEKAREILQKAREDAERMKETARQKGEALWQRSEIELNDAIKAKMKQIEGEIAGISAEKIEEAKAEASQVHEQVKANTANAEEIVMRRLMEKCR